MVDLLLTLAGGIDDFSSGNFTRGLAAATLGSEEMAGAIVGVQAAAASVVVSASVVTSSAGAADRLAAEVRAMPLAQLTAALAVAVEAMAPPTTRIALVSEEAYDVAQRGAVLTAPSDAALTAPGDAGTGDGDGATRDGVPFGIVIGSVAAACIIGGAVVAVVCCYRRKRDCRHSSQYPSATLKELSVAFLQRIRSPRSGFSSPRANGRGANVASCTSSTGEASPGDDRPRFVRLHSMSGHEVSSTTANSPRGRMRVDPRFADPIVAIHPVQRPGQQHQRDSCGGGAPSLEMNPLAPHGKGTPVAVPLANVDAAAGPAEKKADGENVDAMPLAATIVADGMPVTQVGEGVWMDGSTLRI